MVNCNLLGLKIEANVKFRRSFCFVSVTVSIRNVTFLGAFVIENSLALKCENGENDYYRVVQNQSILQLLKILILMLLI